MHTLWGRGGIAPTHSRPHIYIGVSGQRHASAAISSQEKTPGTYLVGGWVDLRAGLDTEVRGNILCLCRGSNPSHPLCSQKLY
jgi:hypothetical protein